MGKASFCVFCILQNCLAKERLILASLLTPKVYIFPYFNFQTSATLAATFEENISPAYLLPILSHISGQTITRGNTLIVFDEIQLCERAVTSLKYFCEEASEYPILAITTNISRHAPLDVRCPSQVGSCEHGPLAPGLSHTKKKRFRRNASQK